MQVFEMSGDEWRLDVRTLIWTGRAAQLGLPDSFRLDRLSGRYLRTVLADEVAPASSSSAVPASASPPAAEPTLAARVPASFALSDEDEAGEDIWAQARTESGWKAHIDARHAYGPWLPLADGARYEVAIARKAGETAAVLEVRPANEAAAKAMRYTPNDSVRARG
jgi:hypothetical protein